MGEIPKTAFAAQIAKIDRRKRIVVFWLMTTEDADGNPVVDAQGDIVDSDEAERAVMELMAEGGAGKAEAMHADFGLGNVVLFPLTRDDRASLGFGRGNVGVIGKAKILDDALWARLESGELSELSYTATGVRVDA